jgi:hypothetical protein
MHILQSFRGRAVLGLMLLAVFLGSFFVFEMKSAAPANAATSSTQALHCRYITYPKTLPAYRCLGNLFTPGTNNNPPGCYSTTKYVCD